VHSQWLHQERGMACLLRQSRFVTIDVLSGTEDLSLPVEFSVTYFGQLPLISGTVFCAPVAYLSTVQSAPATYYS